jgi:hypothetical protein
MGRAAMEKRKGRKMITSDLSYAGYNDDAAAAQAASEAGEYFAAAQIHRGIAAKFGEVSPRWRLHIDLAGLNEAKALQKHLDRSGSKPSRRKLESMIGQTVKIVFPAYKEITTGRLVKIDTTPSGKAVRSIHVDSGYRSPSVFGWGDVGVVELVK